MIIDVYNFWNDVVKQNKKELEKYFHKNAVIRWHNTNEKFTVNEFIKVNCEYPGNWDGKIERIEQINDLIITVTNVFSLIDSISLHVVSFIKLKDNKIISIDEYWGDDGEIPEWRKNQKIGEKIEI